MNYLMSSKLIRRLVKYFNDLMDKSKQEEKRMTEIEEDLIRKKKELAIAKMNKRAEENTINIKKLYGVERK